jgi:hypothetical protein
MPKIPQGMLRIVRGPILIDNGVALAVFTTDEAVDLLRPASPDAFQ